MHTQRRKLHAGVGDVERSNRCQSISTRNAETPNSKSRRCSNEHQELWIEELLADDAFIRDMPSKDALEFLETKKSTVWSYIVSIRELRNTNLPTHRLPHEILAEIFALLADDPSHGWMSFMHVCVHFRRVGLSVPQLWSCLPLRNIRLAEMFLDRCYAGPISLKVGEMYRREKALNRKEREALATDWKRMLSGVHERIRAVCFYGGRTEASILLRALQGPVHKLELLELRCDSWSRRVIPWDLPLPLPSSLCKLVLTGMRLPPNPEIYRNVRHLSLKNQVFQRRPTLNDFLDILRGLPVVEVLDLSFTNGELYWASDHRELHAVELSNLTRMNLEAPASVTSQLLGHLFMPITAKLSISTVVTEIEGFVASMLPRNRQRFRHLSNIESLVFDTTYNVTIKAENFSAKFTWIESDDPVEDPSDQSNSLLPQMLDQISDPLALRELRVDINYTYEFVSSDWYEVLKRTPNLRTLHFSHGWREDDQEDTRFHLCRILLAFSPEDDNPL
jgi:hypothetical protein